MYALYVYALYVCLICMPSMYALRVCPISCPMCMPYMCALYVCLICMPSMYALYVYALYVCLTTMLALSLMPFPHLVSLLVVGSR